MWRNKSSSNTTEVVWGPFVSCKSKLCLGGTDSSRKVMPTCPVQRLLQFFEYSKESSGIHQWNGPYVAKVKNFGTELFGLEIYNNYRLVEHQKTINIAFCTELLGKLFHVDMTAQNSLKSLDAEAVSLHAIEFIGSSIDRFSESRVMNF